ncbi:PAS domain S-box protein [Flavobacterium sp. W20_MBD1_R3]|uniref:PAS domain-containing protein n=1 Tax=Flavobacterium sp. W20_MBD1_R3 TaxID=3240278 RepID=UPI003F939B5A
MKKQKKLIKLFDTLDFQQEFNTMLSLISELCDVSAVFISIIGDDGEIIKAKVGFETLVVPENLSAFIKSIVNHKEKSILVASNQEIKDLASPHSFFAGFPICVNESFVAGTLVMMDAKPKNLSALQLKSLEFFVSQIQSLLELHLQKHKLQEKEIQFEQIIANAKEIFYQLDQEGLIIYASKNWTTILGYDINELIGKSKTIFLHPDDVNEYTTYFKNLGETGKGEKELTFRILHKKGYYVWHATNLKLEEVNGDFIYIGNSRDISEHIEIQQKNLEQKVFYEKILDQLPTDIAVFDNQHRYIYLNPSAIKNVDLRRYIVGKDDFEYAVHTGRDDTSAKIRRMKFLEAIESKNLIEWEDSIESSDGQVFFHSRKLKPVFNDDGTLEMMVGFGVDITESINIQQEILRSKQLTTSIVQNVAVGILVQGPQSEIIENNKAACEMLGLTEDQLLGKTSFDDHWRVIYEDGSDFKHENHPVPQAIQKMKPINNIVMGVYRPLYNDLVWLLVDAIPVTNESGELLYVICSFNDVTAQKNAEKALKISNERFMYSSEATSDALWDWNIITDEILVGESYTALFGHRFKNNIYTGKECEQFIHPEDRGSCIARMNECIKSDIYKWSEEYKYLKSDGTYAYVKDKAVILRNDQGEAIRMIGAMQDITTEKKLRDELQLSEQQFKGAFENSAVGMAIVNHDGYWIEVNNRLCEILGYTKEEFKTLTFQEITYFEDLKHNLAQKEKLVSSEVLYFSLEKRYIHKNKSLVWVHLSVSTVRNNLGEILHYIPQIIDISERIKMEEHNNFLIEENNRNKTNQLNEAQNMYRLLADNTIDLVCLHNLDSSFQYVSPSIQNLLGYTPEELIGKFPQEFVHPDDREMLQSNIDGVITESQDVSVSIRYRNSEGNYFWLETKAILVKENGIPINFQTSTRNITQRKMAEEIVENTLLRERELNELRTNLVATISHEFRTPMTTIRTSAELISLYLENQKIDNVDRLLKRVTIITEEIDRIVELMNDVLIISKEDSKKTSFNPKKLDLKEICLKLINTNNFKQMNSRKIDTNFSGESFTVFADQKLIEHAILNVLNNAIKYSEEYDTISLNLFSIDGIVVVLEIIDSGIGIPENDQQKLFNTFFRASNTNGIQGTGLGLYIAKTFIKKNSGTIKLESKLGKGTKVAMQFPLKK